MPASFHRSVEYVLLCGMRSVAAVGPLEDNDDEPESGGKKRIAGLALSAGRQVQVFARALPIVPIVVVHLKRETLVG